MLELGSEKLKIKQYWQDKQPGQWYSKHPANTKSYYKAVEYERYSKYYPYIPNIAEFDKYGGKKVLEIGVGIGTDLMQYAKNGAICYGIDLTEGAIEKTKYYFNLFNLSADLRVMDAECLDFPENEFDLVYSFGVLHHTPDTEEAINQIYRILKPNGKAIIMLYSKSWQHYIIRVGIVGIIGRELRRMTMQDLINKYSEAYGFSPLTKLYHKKEIKKLFEKFNKISIKHFHYKNNFFQAKYMMGNWIIEALK